MNDTKTPPVQKRLHTLEYDPPAQLLTASHPCARSPLRNVAIALRRYQEEQNRYFQPRPHCRNHRKGGDTHPRYLRHASILIRLLQSTPDLHGRMPEEPEFKRATLPF